MRPPSGRIVWGLFALEACAVLLYAAIALRRAPEERADTLPTAGGARFGRTEADRRRLFVELMRGEKENRERAEKETDQRPWNRNRDDYFHQWEWGRVIWWSREVSIPEWQAWLIMEEGLRKHWPPPPGIPVLADERPLARTTPALAKRKVLIPAPPLPPPRPALRPGPPPPAGAPARALALPPRAAPAPARAPAAPPSPIAPLAAPR